MRYEYCWKLPLSWGQVKATPGATFIIGGYLLVSLAITWKLQLTLNNEQLPMNS